MPATPDEIIKEIQELYCSDSLPWIVGYSGGKDSTASLQLIWLAVAALPVEQRTKEVHVISTDTMVENPVISAWVSGSLQTMARTRWAMSGAFNGRPLKRAEKSEAGEQSSAFC